MDKEFYENNKGIRTPDNLFSKDLRGIKRTLDYAMDTYERSITPAELEGLFFTHNVLTTANKDSYRELFKRINKAEPMSPDIAQEVMGNMFQKLVGQRCREYFGACA